jgi:hypothetical protein
MFKKGKEKTGGRTKGTPNRTTKESTEFLQKILFGQFDDIEAVLKDIKEDDKAKYIDSLNKLLQYVMPKKTDLTSGNKELPSTLNVIVDSSGTSDELKKLISGGETNKDIPA